MRLLEHVESPHNVSTGQFPHEQQFEVGGMTCVGGESGGFGLSRLFMLEKEHTRSAVKPWRPGRRGNPHI